MRLAVEDYLQMNTNRPPRGYEIGRFQSEIRSLITNSSESPPLVRAIPAHSNHKHQAQVE